MVGTDHTYIGIRHTGREAWTYQATQDVTDVIPMESFSRVLVVGQDMARILDMDKYTGELPDVPEDVVETTPEVQTDEPLPTEGETNTDATQQDAGAEGTEGQEKTVPRKQKHLKQKRQLIQKKQKQLSLRRIRNRGVFPQSLNGRRWAEG